MHENAVPAIPFLIEMLGDDTDVDREEGSGFHLWECPVIKVWEAAADTLCKIGVQAIEPLYLGLTENNTIDKSHTARALGLIDDRKATDYLIKALKHPEPAVRKAATRWPARTRWSPPLTSLLLAISTGMERFAGSRTRCRGC